MSAHDDRSLGLRYEIVRAIRESLGLPESVAQPMADCLFAHLSRIPGGLYASPDDMRQARNQRIKAEYTGRNSAALQRRYGISRQTLWRIVSEP